MAEGYNDDIDMPGVWQEKTVTIGGAVYGIVTDNQGVGFNGTTIGFSGGLTTTTSGSGGSYSLVTGPGTFSITATTTTGWQTLEPITVTTTVTRAIPLTLTLSPPDNFIKNGGLEGTFAGWTQTLTMPASFVKDGNRSGTYSLRIFGSGGLSQTGSVSNMYRPVLSFWHKVDGGDGDDRLTVQIAGQNTLRTIEPRTLLLPITPPLTITQPSGGWRHLSLPLVLSGTEVYSGDLSVSFIVTQVGPMTTTFYLDEVSFGGSLGGPNKIYLPLVLKD